MFIPSCRRFAPGCLISLTLLVVGCADHSPPLEPEAAPPLAAAQGANVVHVALPAGNPVDDRASILAALEQVRRGGTIQFAPGTYVIGVPIPFSADFIRITVPHVTLLGHPDGTTLRGCRPFVPFGCVGLELSGGHQTVRNLTFEDMHFALVLGRFSLAGPVEAARVGGYRIEGNTFRNSIQGVHQAGEWPQPAVVRDNRFVNLFAPVVLGAMTVHVLDNDISAPEPASIPLVGSAGAAIAISPASAGQTGRCDHNIIARNRIEGHPEGIVIWLPAPVESCRHNAIRNNSITDSGSRRPGPPFIAGVPIALVNQTGQDGLLEHTLVQGNHLIGALGLGIEIFGASRNRIVNNTIIGVTSAGPFPTVRGLFPLGQANGSGVWVSPGSADNRILNNTFAEIASYAVVLEGDYNHVATTSAGTAVLDLGTGNRVTGPGGVSTLAAPYP
jgi:hypothetical protein